MSVLSEPEMAQSIMSEAEIAHENHGKKKEFERIESQVLATSEQLEALAEHLAKISKEVSPEPIFNQMKRLEELKNKLQTDMEGFGKDGDNTDPPAGIKSYREYLTAIQSLLGLDHSHQMKTKIIQRLVHKIEVYPDRFKIHFFTGEGSFPEHKKRGSESNTDSDPLFRGKPDKLKLNQCHRDPGFRQAPTQDLKNFNYIFGSSSFIGRGYAIVVEPNTVARDFSAQWKKRK